MPDPSFTALPLEQLSAAALTEAQRLGCEHAEVRIERIRSQMIQLRDGQVETTVDDISLGAGCRVVNDGSFGFAATVELDVDAAAGIARDAVATAEATKVALRRRVELAPEPSHGRVEWASAYEIDPTTVPLQDKVALLGDWSRRLLAAPGVDHVTASLLAVMEDKYYCDSSGTSAVQRRVRLHPVLEALSVDPESGMFETMRTLAPPAARGYEYMTGTGWSVEEELSASPSTWPRNSPLPP